ncbi:MAG: hypothetical protein HC927_10860 [Deltaproteobacteria bacterium]|nr:hypothetical protein [Deltaproteobacteria bacterium]
MIRHEVSDDDLCRLIIEESPTWLERAAASTDAHASAKCYSCDAPSWSEIKTVFMTVQRNKCAYCERPLEDPKYGKIEWDIEHFRPKNTMRPWPAGKIAVERRLDYDFETGAELPKGYYMLAHSPHNYVATCKPCNTPLKHDWFPIEGRRVQDSRDIRAYDAERALLPFPLGQHGVRPEEVVSFEGLAAIPRVQAGYLHRMGRVTVDFFDLNGRETLLRQRAEVIKTLWLAFIVIEHVPQGRDRTIAEKVLAGAAENEAPHTNCARAFVTLCRKDPDHARALATAAIEYLVAGSGS